MTEIERKALALLNEGRKAEGWPAVDADDADFFPVGFAIARIAAEKLNAEREAHEAYKREVSDAVFEYFQNEEDSARHNHLCSFILPNPVDPVDPLVEALCEMDPDTMPNEADANNLRAALAARGGKIVWEGE